MDETVFASLEFSAVLSLLRDQTATPIGADLATKLRPATDTTTIIQARDRTAEALRHLEHRGQLPFGIVPDPSPTLLHLDVEGSVLAPLEILDLLAVLKAGRLIKASFGESRGDFPGLWEQAREFPELGNLVRFLDGKIAPSGEVEDHASDDLHRLRRELKHHNDRLMALLEAIRDRPDVARALQDDFVSLRSERHVIPIRSEARHAIQGIVHGVSGSGATVYVEPLETVDINNDIVTLRDQETEEVRRLLIEYTGLLRSRRAEIRLAIDVVGRLDLLMARARLGLAMRAVPPSLSDDGSVRLSGARHPLVEATVVTQNRAIVPLDLAIPGGARVVVLSGPNTGGKTVALKTIGLCSLMFQSGLLVPAHEAILPVFREIFIDIGDRQSISDGLSTFSARVKNVAAMAQHLVPPALVLLDEVGTGTDPDEGVALAIAVLDHFRQRGALIVATTHLEPVKAYAAMTPDCLNAAMQFDDASSSPTYRLVMGIPGRSGALEIARRLGLPVAILDAARALRGEAAGRITRYVERLEEMTAELQGRLRAASQETARLEEDRRRLEADVADRIERQRKALAAEIELAVRNLRDEGERYLTSLKDREVRVRMRREEARAAAPLNAAARRLLRPLSAGPGAAPRERPVLSPGLRVRVDELGQSGTVESVKGERVIVRIRDKRITVSRSGCQPINATEEGGPVLPRGVTLQRGVKETALDELQLRGTRIDEALDRVDKFLDDAYLATLSPLRLVHGVGSGRLLEAIRDFLTRHPHVEEFASAPPDEGGRGVTVVRLKL